MTLDAGENERLDWPIPSYDLDKQCRGRAPAFRTMRIARLPSTATSATVMGLYSYHHYQSYGVE